MTDGPRRRVFATYYPDRGDAVFNKRKVYAMREITSHKVNGLNDAIHIIVTDAPGSGGANHEYEMHLTCEPGLTPGITRNSTQKISFQNGPVVESGLNGISGEALLAIVEDRLKCFQAGPFSCRENAIALTKIQEAMHWLHHRTRERVARGVEGTTAR